MSASLATLIFALGIAGLFWLEHARKSRTSPALWLAVAWLAIGASRSVSEWLGASTAMQSPDQYLEGSLLDALTFAGLEVAALRVLATRRARTRALLRENGPLLLFFAFCLISVMWSDYPFVAFKRWTKATGNLIMVLLVLTDPEPRAAVERLLARVGFVLVPVSVLFIKYYPELGRGFDAWSGEAINTGVTTNKNSLGVVCLLFGLAAVWRCISALNQQKLARGLKPLIAHGATLAMVLWLFSMANSATSLGCFLAGTALILLTCSRAIALQGWPVHVLAAGIVSASVFGTLVNTGVGLVQAMGRNETLTTRTDLWTELFQVPVNPLLGTGFESFWLGERAKALWETYWWHPNQAHNGYLEMYLNLGWLGVGLLAHLIWWGYRNIARALRSDPEMTGLRLAFLITALLYNLTEAAFKVVHPVWVVFLLAVASLPPLVAAAVRPEDPARPRPSNSAEATTHHALRNRVSLPNPARPANAAHSTHMIRRTR